MAQPLTAPLPEALVLSAGYTVTFDAVDPATGAQVAGVVVSNASVFGGSDRVPTEPLPPAPAPLLAHVGTVTV